MASNEPQISSDIASSARKDDKQAVVLKLDENINLCNQLSREQMTKRVDSLVQDNKVLKIEVDALRMRIKSLQAENRTLKENSVQIQVRAEQEEEFISNTLLKKIQELKKEKETLALNYEQEEECLSNDLSRKLTKLKKEKDELRSNLRQEQLFLVNKLVKRIKKLENETNAKQSILDQLRREKVELENTLEQEQESLVNRLWKRLEHLEMEKQTLQRKLDQPITAPPSPIEHTPQHFSSNVGENADSSKGASIALARDIIRLRGEVLQFKQRLRISQTEHAEKMAQYGREERQIREENQRLQQRLQQEIEKNTKLLQFLPENDSFSAGGNSGNFSSDSTSLRGGSRDRSPINISPVPSGKYCVGHTSSVASVCDSQKDEADRSYISSEDDNSCTSFTSSTRCTSCGIPTDNSTKAAFTTNTELATGNNDN